MTNQVKSLTIASLLVTSLLSGCATSSTVNQTAATNTPSTLTVATWNVEHLAYPANTGCKPRTADEVSALRAYANNLDADIVALQEVASVAAAQQVFPADKWNIVMSARPDSEPYECRESGFISTQQKVAFAVKKSLNINSVEQFDDLAVDLPGLRFGLVVNIDTPQGPTDFLSVHMKSGCFVDDYTTSDREACQILAQQVPQLEQWVSAKEAAGSRYVILGDFNHRISAPYNRLTRTLHQPGRSLRIATQFIIGCHPRYPAPIDHIIVGNMDANPIINSATVHHFDDMAEDAMLSDHCAVSVKL